MKISLKAPYKSITMESKDALESVELPSLSIITGKNGSGKTHLLEAAVNGSITFSYMGLNRYGPISFFNYQNLDLSEKHQVLYGDRNNEIARCCDFLNSAPCLYRDFTAFGNSSIDFNKSINKRMAESFCLTLERMFKEKIIERNKIEEILVTPMLEFKEVKREHLCPENFAQQAIIFYQNFDNKEGIAYFLNNGNSFYDMKDYGVEQYLGKKLFNNWNLYIKNKAFFFDEYAFNPFYSTNNYESKVKEFIGGAKSEFYKKYGDNPLRIFNEVLSSYSCNDYFLEDDPQMSKNMVDNLKKGYYKDGKIQTKPHFELIPMLKKGVIKINIDDLSSGEKTLLAIAAMLSEQKMDGFKKKGVLLLDEADANLHPSMIENFIRVIQEVFIAKHNLQVVMVSHSPSTIALAPKDSVFLMRGEDKDKPRIEKVSNQIALDILTNGFATLGKGLTFLDRISQKNISIITEGYNTKYIQKALTLYGHEDDVEVIEGFEKKTGINQLNQLFQFFVKVYHSSKVIFVFDCDAEDKVKKLEDKNNTFVYVFDKNSEHKENEGIEDLFPARLFADEFYRTKNIRESVVRQGKLKKLDPEKFMNHMLDNGTKEDFKNFLPLIEKIRKIKDANS